MDPEIKKMYRALLKFRCKIYCVTDDGAYVGPDPETMLLHLIEIRSAEKGSKL